MKKVLVAILMFAFVPQFASADDNILTTAAAKGSFNTFISLVVAAELDEALQDEHASFTVFAPSDNAFAKLPTETLDALRQPGNRDKLAEILKYHVLPREISIPSKRPSHGIRSAKTLQGEKLAFNRSGKNGSTVKVNESLVTKANILCSNGRIHVIDSVLIPEEDNSLSSVAESAGSFSTLLAAAEAAGLVDDLKGDKPLTVFATTDDAFAALRERTLESLLQKENRDQLASILKYHIVAGSVSAQQAIRAEKATTLAGQKVQFSIREGRLNVNDSAVTANDIEADNGVIHVIDKVLIPSAKQTSKKRSHH